VHDGLIDLFDAGALFLGSVTDLPDDVRNALHADHHVFHRRTGLLHQPSTGIHLRHRIIDERLDFPGGAGGTLGQRAHLRGDHRKPPALFTGACRFHRCVQGKDVGLEGNAIDHADDVDNAARGLADARHGCYHLLHYRTAARSHCRGFGCELVGSLGVIRGLAHGGGEFFHRGGGLLQRTCLLLGTRREIEIAAGDLGGCCRNGLGPLSYLAHDAGEAAIHLVQRLQQLAELVPPPLLDTTVEVAMGHLLRHPDRMPHRAGDGTRDPPRARTAGCHCQQGDGQHDACLLVILRGGFFTAALHHSRTNGDVALQPHDGVLLILAQRGQQKFGGVHGGTGGSQLQEALLSLVILATQGEDFGK